MSSRSNSASAPNTWKMSLSLLVLCPCFHTGSETQSRGGEPVHSLDAMLERTAEPVQLPDDRPVAARAYSMASVSTLRESTAPLVTSRKIFSHPAFWRAYSCKSKFWSAVETRKTLMIEGLTAAAP